MIQGSFFKVDEDSVPEEGQIIFRYLPVLRKEIDESQKQHQFPVYAVLKPYAIDFFYHGPDKDDNGHHVHVRILHLPLSLNLSVKDNLTARLCQAFYAYVELNGDYKFELSKTRQTYWNLDVFSGEMGGIESESEEGNRILIRKIILDFIFDLEHSRVFEASPHYEEVEVHLRENYFFNAIAAKAAYYYNRRLYIVNWRNENVRELYAQNLADAELQWLNILRDSRATETFWHEDWFIPVEEEYKKVLFDKTFDRFSWRSLLDKKNRGKYEEKNIHILRESTRWFLRRYGLLNGIRTLLQFKPSKGKFTLLFILSFIIFPIFLSHFNGQSGRVAYFVYILAGIIPFLAVFFLIYRKMFIHIIGALLPRLIMAIASAWLFLTTTEELWKSSFDIKLEYPNFWVLLLLIPVIVFMAVEIRNLAPDIKAWYLFRRMTYVLGFGLLYSVLIGMFMVHFTGDKILPRSGYLANFYLSVIQDTTLFTLSDRCVAIGLGIAEDENDIFAKYKKKNMQDSLVKDPALSAKIDYLKYNKDSCYAHLKGAKVVLDSIINNSNANIAYKYLSKFSYKADFGIFKLEQVKLKYHIPIFKNYFSLDIFPGLLFYRSFFALFIGIFIQLIFEDKAITEPL